MLPDWLPWIIIAENTSEHYDDHIPQVRTALEKKKPKNTALP